MHRRRDARARGVLLRAGQALVPGPAGPEQARFLHRGPPELPGLRQLGQEGASLSEAGESGALPVSAGVPSSAASAIATPSLGKRKGFPTSKAGKASKTAKPARKKKAVSRSGGSSDEDE